MKFKIVCIGKLKEKYLIAAARDYRLKISRYASLEIIELPEAGESACALETEAKRISAHISPRDFVVCAAVEGKNLSSRSLSNLFKEKDAGPITFIIGGPLGISDGLKKRADLLISFSELTFTHRLARLILLDLLLTAFENGTF